MIEVGHGHVVPDPANAGRIELCPAVIALILVPSAEIRLEEGAVNDLGRDARGARQGRPERLEVRAVAGAEGEAVSRAPDR